MLDIWFGRWYHIPARVGGNSAMRNAMMQEIASYGGNFCGVCPVIGRLNASFALAYIAGLWKNGRRLSTNFHALE